MSRSVPFVPDLFAVLHSSVPPMEGGGPYKVYFFHATMHQCSIAPGHASSCRKFMPVLKPVTANEQVFYDKFYLVVRL